jgi:DNA-binding transcriptional ArsR family regulator
VAALSRGEADVGSLAAAPKMRVPAVSNQLRLMAMLGFLAARSEGTRVLYSLARPVPVRVVQAALGLVRRPSGALRPPREVT